MERDDFTVFQVIVILGLIAFIALVLLTRNPPI